MRGEHGSANIVTALSKETSPHARGTPKRGELHHVVGGNIPACAGNTRHGGSRRAFTKKHPRMRGEHKRSWTSTWSIPETSPHARGTLERSPCGEFLHRNIPACAGNTPDTEFLAFLKKKHPRMRGEHSAATAST